MSLSTISISRYAAEFFSIHLTDLSFILYNYQAETFSFVHDPPTSKHIVSKLVHTHNSFDILYFLFLSIDLFKSFGVLKDPKCFITYI